MTSRRVITAGTAGFLVCMASPAVAQRAPARIEHIKAPEAFVHVGALHMGSDEGGIGTGVSFGSTVTVPLARRLAADLDFQTSQLSRTMGRPDDVYETRRTLLIPSLIYRFGEESVYGYVGGGVGAEFDRSTYTRAGLPSGEGSSLERRISFRGGVAAFPLRRFGVRADFYTASWHLGARIGIGYRFR